MSKYDPLREHLRLNGSSRIEMTFAQIEAIVGGLPQSAYEHKAWWSNEQGGNHVQAHAWMAAGYRTEDPDTIRKRVRFVKGR